MKVQTVRWVALMTVLFSAQISQAYAEDYSSLLKGKRLILQGATCAGIEFKKNTNTVLFYAELVCSPTGEPTDEARVKWITPNIFVSVATKGEDQKHCPPLVKIFQVENISGNQVKLKEIWTGWGNLKDEILQYTIIKK